MLSSRRGAACRRQTLRYKIWSKTITWQNRYLMLRGINSRMGLEYYGKVWSKVVVSVNPNFMSADCSNCGHRVKKSLSTRTHVCPSCHTQICRDTNAAINILKRGLEIVGIEWNNSTVGHTGTTDKSETLGEISTNADNRQLDLVSCVVEPRIINDENPAL